MLNIKLNTTMNTGTWLQCYIYKFIRTYCIIIIIVDEVGELLLNGTYVYTLGMQQYYNLLIYFAIFTTAIQYNIPDKNIDILQYIATFIAFKVVSIQLLHYKNDWTSCNHKYTIQFLAILHVST